MRISGAKTRVVWHGAKSRLGFWSVIRYADVVWVYRDTDTFTTAHGMTLDTVRADRDPGAGMMVEVTDPPDHRRLRRSIGAFSSAGAVSAMAPAAATAATAAPSQIDYLDGAAKSALGRDYKERFLTALDLHAGQVVLDVGCGPGTDLARLAGAVGNDGSVIGVDHDWGMLEEARRRLVGYRNVELYAGDAHALPLDEACVDRARADRVLQHLENPAGALSELRRVVRPGGVVGLAEPDWDTLAIDSVDTETSRSFTRFVVGRFRNATVGRQLARLAEQAQFAVRSVDATAVVFRDFEAAEQILGLRRNAARAVQTAHLTESAAQRWIDGVARGPFLAYLTFVMVTAQA